MTASQDYRDGASTAAHQMAHRLTRIMHWGVPLDARVVEQVAEELHLEWGGVLSEDVAMGGVNFHVSPPAGASSAELAADAAAAIRKHGIR